MRLRSIGVSVAVLYLTLSGLAQMPPTPTTLSSTLPADAPPKPSFQFGNLNDVQRKFDIFAWQEFVALNWPPGKPGQPGPGTIGKTASGDNPTVWETYMASSQVFQPGAKPPGPWGTTQPIPPFCPAPPAALKGKIGKILPLIAKGDLQDEYVEAFTTSPLIDVNGKYTRYEIRMNKVEFDKILQGSNPPPAPAKPWYIPNNQVAPVSFPAGVYQTDQIGALEVKAAWRQVSPGQAHRYHTAWAYITYAPNASGQNTKCAGPLLMGLVGLHIIHKTASAPQWLWATFEQVDNAPSAPNPPLGNFSYNNNPKCTFSPACANQEPTPPAGGWDGDPGKTNTPVQVIRATPIPAAKNNPTTGINPAFQKLLRNVYPRSVWQYYQLVDTQWPQRPGTVQNPNTCYHGSKDNPALNFACDGPNPDQGPGPFPAKLANTTAETYFQQTPGNKTAYMGTCMGCHSFGTVAASGSQLFSDFSFLLGDAQPPSTEANPPKVLRRVHK